jgi:hypothetical protein
VKPPHAERAFVDIAKLRDFRENMQNAPVKLLDVVALLGDKPEEGLVAGQVGTGVEIFAPGAFEVEFLDSHGQTVSFPK